jgi:hypothetical protein
MIYTMSDSGQLEGLSGGKCFSAQTDLALAAMVKTFSALFRSPPMVVSRPKKRASEANPLVAAQK